MADAGGDLSAAVVAPGSSPAAATEPRAALRLLALAPLPYRREGKPAFHGGGTVFYAELLAGLARRGHAVSVIAEAPPLEPGERRSGLDLGERLEVEWFAYEHHSSVRQPAAAARRELRARVGELVRRGLRNARPDVVLVGREVVLPFVVDACREHGVATFLVAHGPAVGELDAGRYADDLRIELTGALRAAGRIVAVAEHVAATLARLGVKRAETIPNVVDAGRFVPAARDPHLLRALDIAPDALVVGHVSVLRPWKRVGDLVDSAAIVLRAAPGCVYLIVGDGPCRAELEERVRRLGLAAAFRFTGEIAHADVPRHLALADVVVQPSEREGAPLVYREAQACGRALLASDIAAAREAIAPGRTGLLFRTGDVAHLAAQTLALLRDGALRRRLGAAARATAERDGIERWLERYEDALWRTARGI